MRFATLSCGLAACTAPDDPQEASGLAAALDQINSSIVSEDGVLTEDEFTDLDRLHAVWSETKGGEVHLELQNTSGVEATCTLNAVLTGPSLSGPPIVLKDIFGELAAFPQSAVVATVSLSDVSRVAWKDTVRDNVLVSVQAACTFADGTLDSVSSDAYAVADDKLVALAPGDSRRAWARSGLPDIDPQFGALAEAYAPGLWSELEAFAATGSTSGGISTLTSVSKVLCFQQPTTYQTGQSGVGEDVWPETTATYRAHSFGLVFIDGTAVWFGYLNVYGCTPTLSIPTGNHGFDIVSLGSIGDSLIRIGNYDTNNLDGCDGCTEYQWEHFVANVDSTSLQTIPYTPTGGSMSKLNIYPAVALALLKNNSGMYEYRIQVKLEGNNGSATNTYSTYAQVRLGYSHQDNKMTAIHEVGHATQRADTGVVPEWFNSCAYAGSNSPCGTQGSGHYFNSIEYTGCGIVEGFGNFYSAVTWNDATASADCYYEGGADCAGSATYANRYMKSTCSGSPWNGLGVEWDWMRAFWDIVTHSSGGTTPSVYNIRQWLAQVKIDAGGDSGINADNAYTVFDGAANTVGGALNSVWDTYKGSSGSGNGVDVADGP